MLGENLKLGEPDRSFFPLSSHKEEKGRGEEAVWVGNPSLRLSPRSWLAGREAARLRPPVRD